MSGLNKRWQFMTLPLPFLSLNLMPIRVVLLRNATWDFCNQMGLVNSDQSWQDRSASVASSRRLIGFLPEPKRRKRRGLSGRAFAWKLSMSGQPTSPKLSVN
jgi:hypothetical protein